jgi:hypothetical protein
MNKIIDKLVEGLIADNIWSKLKGFYPLSSSYEPMRFKRIIRKYRIKKLFDGTETI